jgi:hypothetical protein
MQDVALNEEFFQENYAECSKRVHPVTFLQEFFQKSESSFNKQMTSEALSDLIQSYVESPMDPDLIEELFDRIRLEKKKNLTLNEFFKVFHEAETVILLKVEYMRFLLDQNKEIQQKIEHFLDLLKGFEANFVAKGSKNVAKIEILKLFGFKASRSFIRVKYLDFQNETKLVSEDGNFKESPFELPLKSLDEYIEFQVIRLDPNNKDETFIGKSKLSFFFLDFTKKNEAKLNISPGMELLLNVEFEFPEKKRIIAQMEAKIRDMDKENTRITQEKHGFKVQLLLLMKPFNKKFDSDDFYRFDQIQLETPKTLRIFEFMNLEEKQAFSKKYPQDFPAGPKELNEEFEPKTIEMEGRKDGLKENATLNEGVSIYICFLIKMKKIREKINKNQ